MNEKLSLEKIDYSFPWIFFHDFDLLSKSFHFMYSSFNEKGDGGHNNKKHNNNKKKTNRQMWLYYLSRVSNSHNHYSSSHDLFNNDA